MMNTLVKGIGILLVLATTSAQAIPTLAFHGGGFLSGGVEYTNATQTMQVDAELIGSLDVGPLIFTGSSLSFTANLDSTTTAAAGMVTFGHFSSSNLVITNGDATVLLEGSFNDLTVYGGNGLDFGVVNGTFASTGGSLATEFGLGTLFALELNLSTLFSNNIFLDDFTAEVNGQITGEPAVTVPEPAMLALLGLGVLLIGFFNYRSKASIKA